MLLSNYFYWRRLMEHYEAEDMVEYIKWRM